MNLENKKIENYSFLAEMYEDNYYPNVLVDKGKQILVKLCKDIEDTKPKSLSDLYVLTHQATEEFNGLEEEFDNMDSEIETVARECIGQDFYFIAQAYGFEADREELIATRDW